MKHAETVKALSLLAAVWPTREVTPAMIEAYHLAWEDIPYAILQPAIKAYLTSGTFFPAPAEIRERALRLALDLPPAEVAWDEVRRQIGAVGLYGDPQWSSLPLSETVRTLGWRTISVTEESDLGTLRAQFRNTYDAYARRTLSGDARTALAEHAQRQAALNVPPVPVAALPEGSPVHLDVPAGPAYATIEARRRWQAANPEKPVPSPSGGRAAQIAALMALPSWRDLPEDYRRQLLAKHGLTEPAPVAEETAVTA